MEYLNSHISIHALREEGDQPARQSCPPPVGFLSTPSARRATLHPSISPCCTPKFLSTPSARRATGLLTEDDIAEVISIHALREEGDRSGKSGRAEF